MKIILYLGQIFNIGILTVFKLLVSMSLSSFDMRIGFLNDPLCDECDPTQWVSVPQEVILHFLKNRVSTTNCLFSCLQHKNIKKHSKDEI